MPPSPRAMGRLATFVLLAGAIATVILVATHQPSAREITYDELRDAISAGRVVEVAIGPTEVTGTMRGETPGEPDIRFRSIRVDDEQLVPELRAHRVPIRGVAPAQSRTWLLAWLIPIVLLVALFIYTRRIMERADSRQGLLSVAKNKAKIYAETGVSVTFDDVAGVDEAKTELREVIEFLNKPETRRVAQNPRCRGAIAQTWRPSDRAAWRGSGDR